MTHYFILSSPSSRDELRAPAEWLLPSPAAGAHGRVPAHEDAQEDPGTPVVRVLRHLRQDGTTHLHGNLCVRVCLCVDLSCVFKESFRSDSSDIIVRSCFPCICLVSPLVCCVLMCSAVTSCRTTMTRRLFSLL